MTSKMALHRLILLAVTLAGALQSLQASGPPVKEYRISGVVVSARDGSPVPYCRLTAYSVAAPLAVSTSGGQLVAGRDPGLQPGIGPPPEGRMGGVIGAVWGAGPAPQKAPETTADSSGRFSLDVPRAGSWRLSAAARGFRQQNYDEHEGFFSAIVLSESTPAFGLTFRLTPDSALTGLVFDDSGEPVMSAQVMVELIPPAVQGDASVPSRPRSVGAAQTDDRGRYVIGGLAPGQYRLRVQAQPWYSSSAGRGGAPLRLNAVGQTATAPSPDPSLDFVYPVTWFPGVDEESAAQELVLAPGEERQADLRLTAIPSIHLKVPRPEMPEMSLTGDGRGRPQQPRMVSVSRVGGNGFQGMQQMVPAGATGNDLDFGGLAPGTYEVRIPGSDGRPGQVQRIEVKPGSPATLTMDGAQPLIPVQLQVDGIPGSKNVMFEFFDTETGERIPSMPTGRGRGGPQRDVQGGDTPAIEDPGPSTRTVMLEPHSYAVSVTGGAGAYLMGITSEGAKVTGRVVTVAGPAAVTLHLANKRTQVEGIAHIVGAPAAGAMVLLVPATFGTAGSLAAIERAETNTDGSFRIASVPPGPYILVVIDHGWKVDWRNPATLGGYLLHGVPVNLRADARERQEVEAVSPN